MPAQMAKLCRDKAVIVKVYGEKATKRRKSNASTNTKVHHVVHHHHHLHVVHHTVDRKPVVSPAGDRRARLLDFSRRLRESAAAHPSSNAAPPPKSQNGRDSQPQPQHRRQGSNGKFQNFFRSIIVSAGGCKNSSNKSRKINGAKSNSFASTTANPVTSIINGIKMHNSKRKKKSFFAKLFASLTRRK
ncbi:unnamed protein product [Linum tenue]|uniref:Uncharacterized protein n=1 Tax=Linum tenue TaxID=586396 RepID=A0AAV0KAC1_9ROSI|nr:unnamed protein product [Linum tenue]